MSVRLGPIGQRIADTARRRWSELKASWLVLAYAGLDLGPRGGTRILERRKTKGMTTLRTCSTEGLVELVGTKRRPLSLDGEPSEWIAPPD